MTTMISERPISKTRLGVGLDSSARRSPSEPQAWKKNIGTKPIPARLALLPDGESRMKRVGISAILQTAFVGFILIIPLVFPQQMKTALKYTYTEVARPISEIPVAPPPKPPKIVKTETPPPTPPPVEVKLNPVQPHIFVTPKVIQPKVRSVDAKAPELNPVFETAKVDTTQPNQPKRPKEEVKVGTMSSGNATPATVKAPVEKVQTGGFGDPNGLPGKGNPNAHLIVNASGLNTLPNGPGYGNGTGGDKGIRGTVASTGFGNGTANPPPGGGKRGTVQAGGFGDESVAAAEAPKKKTANNGPAALRNNRLALGSHPDESECISHYPGAASPSQRLARPGPVHPHARPGRGLVFLDSCLGRSVSSGRNRGGAGAGRSSAATRE